MLRLLIDENLDQRILRGLRLKLSEIDYIVVQETDLRGIADSALLAWAAQHGRILVTHDINTVPKFAYARIDAGESMVGVIVIPEDMAIGAAIEELIMAVECCAAREFENQVKYLPL